jgi:enediyne polyketide synthase
VHTTGDPIVPMPEGTAPGSSATPIAIVGLACRFPDADDPLALFESALAGRRAFRRLPAGRLGADADPEAGHEAGLAGPASGAAPRAAVLEGWQFDRAGFAIPEHTYLATDPAHWLALETAGRALADAGFPGGQGLARDRAGVIIGNTLTGEVSRAAALRTRWPFVRAVLTTALAAGDVPPAERARALLQATTAFAAVPEVSGETLAGSQSGAIADRICRQFGFRGGGQAVDTAHSSSLLAVASAAALLTAGELDFVLAGGVDISLDPFELGALAQAGVLATGAMRIYDTSPTGFLPGEGCGMLALMRAADARAADMPVYAEIVGWGVSSAGHRDVARADPDSQLLALQRAYHRAGVDPADIQLIEGDGRGTADGDLAELTALTVIRAGAAAPAVLGSVKANIGHTKAAAGAAGLIKAALAVNAGVLPPVTGCARPHPLLGGEEAVLRVPRTAESWPSGTRLAGVSSMDPAGSHVHVVLRREPNQAAFPQHAGTGQPSTGQGGTGQATGSGTRPFGSWTVPGAPRPEIFAFSGPDRETVAAQLARVTRAAADLSDSELGDLACQLGRQAAVGPVRVAVVAAGQDELTRLTREAAGLLPSLASGRLTTRPGLFAADGAAGRVVLLFPGEASTTAAGQDWPGPGSQPAIVQASLSALRWLDSLGVRATAALGHGVGEITGLIWAGSLAESDAAALVAQRAGVLAAPGARRTAMVCLAADADAALALMPGRELVIAAYHGPRCHVLAGPADPVHDVARRAAEAGIQGYVLDLPYALHSPALADLVAPLRGVLAGVTFAAPSQRLISTVTGREVTSAADIRDLLCDQLVSPVRFAEALAEAAGSADLLLDTGPGQAMAALAAGCSEVPAVSLSAGPAGAGGPDRMTGNGPVDPDTPADPDTPDSPATPGSLASPGSLAAATTAAALFAVGAITSLGPLLAGRPSRPIDIGRERIFITNPYSLATAELASREKPADLGKLAGLEGSASPEEPPGGSSPAGAAILAGAGRLAIPGAAGLADPGAAALAGEDADDPSRLPGAQHDPWDTAAIPGVGPWVRCFTEELRAPRFPVLPVDEEPWRLHATTRQPFGRMAAEVFEDDPAATGVLAVIGDLADPDAAATLVTAAQEALAAGMLVVITPAAGLAGFCASLHAEHPSLGITLIRTANSMAGLLAAQRYAAATDGQFRELVLDTKGEPREPVMVASLDRPPADEAADPEPGAESGSLLGPTDVVLVSGGVTRDLLAAARVLADSGARLVLAGAAGPGEAAAIDIGLTDLRGAGADVTYFPADLSDPDEAEAAITSVEQRVGPVTAVVHAASTGPLRECADLAGDDLGEQVARQADGLSNVLGAVSAAGLRVLVTLGTVPARYGAARNCAPALAASALAEQARRLRPSLPGCRILHADWLWPGGSDQIRVADLTRPRPLGLDDATAAELNRLLLVLLADAEAPGRVAMHGRLGEPPADPDPAPEIRGRFLETARVYYPGVELVADTKFSPRTDPYLADHHIDGLLVLPLSIALEAMAQAASVLAGRPLRHLAGARMDAPVVLLPGDQETTLRICALRRADAVETVLRCAGSGFQVGHFRALFPLRPGTPPAQSAPEPAVAPQSGQEERTERLGLTVASAGGIVDGTDLYGPVFFQAGPFRRVAFLPELTSRSCSALIRGADDRPWFRQPEPAATEAGATGAGAPGVDEPLVLGSPGLNDAVMHMLQACVPHRRMLPAGFEALTVSGAEVRGAVQVRAERQAGLPSGWQVTAADAAGHTVLAVSGLQLRDVGPLEPSAPWHPTLLAAALEGWAAEFGLDPALRVTVSCGQPGQDRQPRGDGLPWLDASTGLGPLAGFQLTVRASMPVACYWAPVQAGRRPGPVVALPADSADDSMENNSSRNETQPGQLARQLRERTGEPPEVLAARMKAISACLTAAGRTAGVPLKLGPTRDAGWVQVEAGTATVACTITAIEGVRGPVVLALATWPAAIHDAAGHAVRSSGSGARAGTGSPGSALPGESTTGQTTTSQMTTGPATTAQTTPGGTTTGQPTTDRQQAADQPTTSLRTQAGGARAQSDGGRTQRFKNPDSRTR